MNNRLDDYELVKQSLNGNNDAFAELLSRYKNLVYSVVLRMVNDSEEANDLAQEVFIKIYKNLDKYHPDYKFSTWIIRIATNHIIDYRRKKKYDTVNIDDIVSEPSSGETPEEEYLRKEKNITVSEALKELPEMYLIPILLYHKHDMNYQEIADTIGEPLSKVKNRIFRGRKMLKEILIKKKQD